MRPRAASWLAWSLAGRLPSRRWRPLALFSGAVIIVESVVALFKPGPLDGLGGARNPVGLDAYPWLAVVDWIVVPFLPLCIVASTLAIAALFNPLRRRIQFFIDRRFYRRKYDAQKTSSTFSKKLREETNLEALDAELLSLIRETVQPEHVSLWLQTSDRAVKR
jgi:hypothetical protein